MGSSACLAPELFAAEPDRFVVFFAAVLFFFADFAVVVRFVLPDVFFPEDVVFFLPDAEDELLPVPFPLLRVVLEAI
jgi:hypothetical protein